MSGVTKSGAAVSAALTIGAVGLAFALVIAAPFAVDTSTKGVYPGIGVAALVTWVVLVVATWSIRWLRVEVAGWTAWLAATFTISLTMGPIALVALEREGLAYQISQALGIGGISNSFGDMDVVLSWLGCPRVGIDPYSVEAVSCAVGPSNYGPAIFWLSPTGLGRSAAPLLGVLGVILSALAIAWLMRQSRGLGRITLLLASASAAWILLQERANLDAAVIWCAVLLVWLVRRQAGLWPWVVAAIPIWFLGAWKYYPFAMAIALVPVLRLKHGWTVLAGFGTLTVGYLVVMRDYVALSLTSNSSLSGGEFWGIGRDVAAAFIAGEAEVAPSWEWADVLVLAVAVLALGWGWSIRFGGTTKTWDPQRPLRAVPLTAESMLAISGSSAIFLSVVLSGFGYHYKAALLVLVVPLLTRFAASAGRIAAFSGILMLSLTVISVLVTGNLLLTSIATTVVAAFATGAALRPLVRWTRIAFSNRSKGGKRSVAAPPTTM